MLPSPSSDTDDDLEYFDAPDLDSNAPDLDRRPVQLRARHKGDAKVRSAGRYVSSQRYVRHKSTSCPYDRLHLSERLVGGCFVRSLTPLETWTLFAFIKERVMEMRI